MVTGAVGTDEGSGGGELLREGGEEGSGFLFGGSDFLYLGAIAATIGAGMACGDLELEFLFLAGDVELTGMGAGLVVLVAEGFEVTLEVFCGEDREKDIVEGNDPEVILVLCDTEFGALVEVFPIEIEGTVDDDSLEELEGVHVFPSFGDEGILCEQRRFNHPG